MEYNIETLLIMIGQRDYQIEQLNIALNKLQVELNDYKESPIKEEG